jgi:hypothetical protein
MSIGLVCWSIVEGQGRVRFVTLIELVSSWLVVIPIAGLLVFVCNINLLGIAAAVVVGYTVGGVWTTYTVLTTNWQKQSHALIQRDAALDLALDKFRWGAMPEDVRKAAHLLGYTQELWHDQAKTPLMVTKKWEALSKDQCTAARVLGFNRIWWDRDWDINALYTVTVSGGKSASCYSV